MEGVESTETLTNAGASGPAEGALQQQEPEGASAAGTTEPAVGADGGSMDLEKVPAKRQTYIE